MANKVRIEKLIYEGWGIGRDGNNPTSAEPQGTSRTLFVKKTVPGDIIEPEVIKEKKSYAECLIKRLIEPSAQRVYPECPFFNDCGSCDHQNISYPKQLKYKEEIFTETLQRQGIDITPERIIAGSDQPFFYRNSIRLFFLIDENNQIGFARHSARGYQHFVRITNCLLQSKQANQFMAAIAKTINDNFDDKSAFWQLRIREGKFTGEFMVEVITFQQPLPDKKVIIEALRQFPEIKSVYHTIAYDKNMKRVKRMLLFGSPVIREKIGRFAFQISPESFFQTNSLGVKTLYDTIKKYVDVEMGNRILDLFCGTGTIGIYLSTLAKEVIGVEIVPEAIRDARDNARMNKIHNCEFICDDSERWLEKNLSTLNLPFSTIIVDPPRAGLTKRTIELLSTFNFQLSTKIIYVSCNPATFARDIKTFSENGTYLKKVQPIDMFPQTHHIECVGLLEKKMPA